MSNPNVLNIVYYCASSTEVGIPAQRSRIRHIDVVFDQAVNVDGTQIVLDRLNGPASGTGTVGTSYIGNLTFTSHLSSDGMTLTLAPSGTNGVQYGSLEDGNYELTIPAAAVTAQDDSSPMAADYVADFFCFYGDTNGNTKVNNVDLPVMQHAVGTIHGNPNYRSWLDFGGRGQISSADYAEFNLNYKWQLNADGTRTLISP